VLVLIDDILIYSKNEEEHVEHLGEMLILLREHQLYAKLSKSSFFLTKFHYLGKVVSKEAITTYLKYIRVVMEWVVPRNVDEDKSFMVLANYCKKFIKKFSWISYHIKYFNNNRRSFKRLRSVELVLSS